MKAQTEGQNNVPLGQSPKTADMSARTYSFLIKDGLLFIQMSFLSFAPPKRCDIDDCQSSYKYKGDCSMRLFILALASIISRPAFCAPTEVKLRCETAYGYHLQAQINHEFLRTLELSYSGTVLLREDHEIQSEKKDNMNFWKIEITPKNRVVSIFLPSTTNWSQRILGSLVISGPQVSAEFPLTCEVSN